MSCIVSAENVYNLEPMWMLVSTLNFLTISTICIAVFSNVLSHAEPTMKPPKPEGTMILDVVVTCTLVPARIVFSIV